MCLPIIGAVISGAGAAMGAMNQSAAYKAEQKIQERQALIERQQGAYESQRTREDVDRTLGAARAGFAANGLDITYGSPADTLIDSEEEGALDVAAIRYNTRLKSDTSRYKAAVAGMNAKAAGSAAPIAFLSPVISGVAKYASSFGGSYG